jgi:peptidoglycan/LPS O-acetylase OafA/YrhL
MPPSIRALSKMTMPQIGTAGASVPEAKGEIRSLTALRGIAAMGVMIGHFRDQFGDAIQVQRHDGFLAHSYLFVDFFFILSGFVIALSYAHFFQNGFAANRYLVFLVKRLGRIYPLHIVVLAAFVASEAAKYLVATSSYPPFSVNSLNALVANIVLIQAWGFYDYFTWNHPAWSISTEWFAYLIFPFLMLAISKVRSYAAALITVIACFLVLQWLIRTGGFSSSVDLFLIRCVPSFVLGMVVYQITLFASGKTRVALSSDLTFLLCLVVSAVAIALPGTELLAIAAFFFTVLTGSMTAGPTARFLSKGPLYFLGAISYSIYLVHSLLQRVWQMLFQVVWHSHMSPTAAWAAYAICIALVIVVSKLSYDLIEKPGRDFVSRQIVPLLKAPVTSPKPG